MFNHKAPNYRLELDGVDITPRFNPRLINLTLSENRADEADQLDITLTDHDGKLELPRKGVKITLALGFKADANNPKAATALVEKGTFIVDEIEHSGPPDQVTLRARSAELTSSLRRRNKQSWHKKTVGNILKTIAARNGLKPMIDTQLAKEYIDHIDQTSESDIAFITRLGKRFDAVATVKQGSLIFLNINETKTASGQVLPVIKIARTEVQNHNYTIADRDNYTGVKAYYSSISSAQQKSVTVGSKDNLKELPDMYANLKEAQDAAKSEWQQIERSTTTLALTLSTGRPDLMAQSPVKVAGFKSDIDVVLWLTAKARHALGGGGLITSVELEKAN